MRSKKISTDHVGLGLFMDRHSATDEMHAAHWAFYRGVVNSAIQKPGQARVELNSTLTPGMAKEVPTDHDMRGYLWELSVATFSGHILTAADCFIEVDDQDRFIRLYREGGFVGWAEDREMSVLHH